MTSVDAFFAFARERHSIHLRRRAGLSEPWTQDPILQHYRFTNVFRELDRTTVWFCENVRDRLRDDPSVLLATVIFRWFNKIETGEAIFQSEHIDPDGSDGPRSSFDWLLYGPENLGMIRSDILRARGSGPYVTGSYIIKTPDGYSKLDGVLKCIEWFMEQSHSVPGANMQLYGVELSFQWRGAAHSMLSSARLGRGWRLEEAWSWLRQFPYLGDFMAYEIVTDLRWTALLDRAPDIMTWANPGPGATRGIGRVFWSGDKDKYNQHRDKQVLIGNMQHLLARSQEPEFWPQWTGSYYITGTDPEYQMLREGIGREPGDWPPWEMREVEHTLCEFDKYERARTGEGRPRGVFRK